MSERKPAEIDLRHTVATLAYRAAKALRNAPASFAAVRAAPESRSALEILAHLGDLLDWARSLVAGEETWHDSEPLDWPREVERFFAALQTFDGALATGTVHASPERLFQGPIADALSHVGQLALLRRLAQAPIRGENFERARIEVGRVGADQPPAVREFD